VLQRLAATVMGSLRAEDAFCRLGGEEFGIIMRDCTTGEASMLAERLRELVEKTRFVYGGDDLPVTMSLGVATYHPDRHRTSADLIEEADQHLYQAKRTGRNRVCSPEPEPG
jgi:diguanylate cyclase (GGDEF)-like protein